MLAEGGGHEEQNKRHYDDKQLSCTRLSFPILRSIENSRGLTSALLRKFCHKTGSNPGKYLSLVAKHSSY